MKQDFSILGNTTDGIKLGFNIINYSQAKDRKIIAKSFKDKILSLIQDSNSKGFLFVIKLLRSVDDTKLLEKMIIKVII